MKKSVLMLQNNMNPPGGGNTVSLWILEAIKRDYEVTVLTWEQVDFEVINEFYGTSFKTSDFNIITAPNWIRLLLKWVPDPWQWQRFCILMRICKRIQQRFDILLSAHDETDFGRAGIQYVHYPFQQQNWALEQEWRNADGWLDKAIKTVTIGLRPWRIISGFSFERMMKNKTLVNSDWTGRQYLQSYAAGAAETVYPPVVGDFPVIPWQQKEDGFVCIGRFATDKRIEQLIAVIEQVRRRYPGIKLHVVGTYSPWEDGEACYRSVMQLARQHAGWLQIHENLSREELLALVARQRYGIHGKLDEHFGLAIAEMVMAGCIPFVPNGGGQVEIVGRHERLVYGDDVEAIDKIGAVLADTVLQRELHDFLARQKQGFTLTRFRQRVLDVLKDYQAPD